MIPRSGPHRRTPDPAAPGNLPPAGPPAAWKARAVPADLTADLLAQLAGPAPVPGPKGRNGPASALDKHHAFTSRPQTPSSTSQPNAKPSQPVQNTAPSAQLASQARRAAGSNPLAPAMPGHLAKRAALATLTAPPELAGEGPDPLRAWALLDALRTLFQANGLDHRAAACRRFILPESVAGLDGVPVLHRAPQAGRRAGARFGNLNKCGNVHACPKCAAKVARTRADELAARLRQHVAGGGRLMFVTLTHRHERGNQLAVQLAAQGRALEALHRSRKFRALLHAHGVVGHVRSLEVTHSDRAGWHAHVHYVVLLAGNEAQAERHREVMAALDARRATAGEGTEAERLAAALDRRRPVKVARVRDLPAFGRQFLALWMKAAEAAGLDARPQAQRAEVARGDLATLETLANYLSKPPGELLDVQSYADAERDVSRADDSGAAGLAREATGAPTKLARTAAGRTPFQMLSDYAESGDPRAGALFTEYAAAVQGRRALSYSDGLKALYNVEEATDDEAAGSDQAQPEEHMLALLTREDWTAILKAGRGMRGRVLEVARTGDAARLLEFVAMVRQAQDDRPEPPTPRPRRAKPAPSQENPATSPAPVEPAPSLPPVMPTLFDAGGPGVQGQQLASLHLAPGGARAGARGPAGALLAGPRVTGRAPSGPPDERPSRPGRTDQRLAGGAGLAAEGMEPRTAGGRTPGPEPAAGLNPERRPDFPGGSRQDSGPQGAKLRAEPPARWREGTG